MNKDSISEYLLFDFGLKVGDTFSSFTYKPFNSLKVTLIDSIKINNNQYRRIIRFGDYGCAWVEGIGNWYDGFFGIPCPLCAWEFKCQNTKGIQNIGESGNCSCIEGDQTTDDKWAIVSINQLKINETTNIFPNPTYGIVNVIFDKVIQNCQIYVYDIYGRIVLKSEYNSTSELDIDLSMLKDNFYNIILVSENGRKSFKILKK